MKDYTEAREYIDRLIETNIRYIGIQKRINQNFEFENLNNETMLHDIGYKEENGFLWQIRGASQPNEKKNTSTILGFTQWIQNWDLIEPTETKQITIGRSCLIKPINQINWSTNPPMEWQREAPSGQKDKARARANIQYQIWLNKQDVKPNNVRFTIDSLKGIKGISKNNLVTAKKTKKKDETLEVMKGLTSLCEGDKEKALKIFEVLKVNPITTGQERDSDILTDNDSILREHKGIASAIELGSYKYVWNLSHWRGRKERDETTASYKGFNVKLYKSYLKRFDTKFRYAGLEYLFYLNAKNEYDYSKGLTKKLSKANLIYHYNRLNRPAPYWVSELKDTKKSKSIKAVRGYERKPIEYVCKPVTPRYCTIQTNTVMKEWIAKH